MTRVGGARVALVAAEVWLLTTVAHAAAGGELPSLPWLLGLGALVVLATAWVLRSRVTPWLVAGGLAVAQLGLHVALDAMSAGSAPHAGMAMGGHAHHDHTAMADAAPAGLLDPGLLDSVSTRMVLAHVLSALLTGFVWWLRRRVVEIVLHLGRPAVADVRRHAAPASPATRTWPHPRPWLLGDPGRAPPRAFVSGLSPSGSRPQPPVPSYPFCRTQVSTLVCTTQGALMSLRTLARLGAAPAVLGIAVLGVAAPAGAHVTITPSTTAAGAFAVLTVSVPHGCDGSPTTQIAIADPRGDQRRHADPQRRCGRWRRRCSSSTRR